MTNPLLRMGLLCALAFPVAAVMSGCEKDTPLERAGERIEDATDNDSPIEEAGENIDDALDEAGERIEDATDEVRE